MRLCGAAEEALDELGNGFSFNLRSAGSVVSDVVGILCISTPLSSGIAIIAGPGTQVGATWAEKSSPIGPSGQSNLAGQRGLAVKVMGTVGNQPTCKSSQR